jgi:predicted RNase H-like nuclease
MSFAAWRDELEALVAEGRRSHSVDEIAAALRTAGEALIPPTTETLRPPAPVLGVDRCTSGWVGVLLQSDGRASVHAAATITALVEQVRESADPVVLAVAIQVELPDRSGREEVGAWTRSDPDVVVIEVQPEVSFARMAGVQRGSDGLGAAGLSERRAVLERAGFAVPAWFRGSGFGEDDLLDACAAAWTAVRHAREESESPSAAIWA